MPRYAFTESPVQRRSLQQFRVRAHGGHAAPSHDHNAIRADDGGKAVRNDHQRLVLDEAADRLLNERLVFGIGKGRRLVKHPDGAVLEHGPRNGDTLALAPGKARPGIPGRRIISAGQCLDEAARGSLRSLFHFPVRGVRPAEADILPQADVEQEIVLRDIGDGLHDLRQRELADIHPAEQDAPAIRFPKADQQLGERGLARAGRSDDGGHAAFHDLERHILQDLRPVPVWANDT